MEPASLEGSVDTGSLAGGVLVASMSRWSDRWRPPWPDVRDGGATHSPRRLRRRWPGPARPPAEERRRPHRRRTRRPDASCGPPGRRRGWRPDPELGSVATRSSSPPPSVCVDRGRGERITSCRSRAARRSAASAMSVRHAGVNESSSASSTTTAGIPLATTMSNRARARPRRGRRSSPRRPRPLRSPRGRGPESFPAALGHGSRVPRRQCGRAAPPAPGTERVRVEAPRGSTGVRLRRTRCRCLQSGRPSRRRRFHRTSRQQVSPICRSLSHC